MRNIRAICQTGTNRFNQAWIARRGETTKNLPPFEEGYYHHRHLTVWRIQWGIPRKIPNAQLVFSNFDVIFEISWFW